MTWRRIVAFADGAGDAVARTQMALELARRHAAQLTAIVPALMPAPLYGTSIDLLSKGLDELRRSCLLEANASAARLKTLAPSGPDFSVRVEDFLDGDLRALAAALARASDLVIVGQPDALDRSSMDTEVFVGALLGSGRPCLMLPRWKESRPCGRRAFIAWKATPEATRALAGAMPLLCAAEVVRLCIVNPRGAREGEDDKSMAELADYLRSHGVRAENPAIRKSPDRVESVIGAELESFGADLLVMGAYSRPRMQEIVFGGMTATMIRQAQIPVLFAH